MSSPRHGYDSLRPQYHTYHNQNGSALMQGGATTLNVKSLRTDENHNNTPGMYANPKVVKERAPKKLALGKISGLKGIVDSIITDTKSETRDIRAGFKLLRGYQEDMADGVHTLIRAHSPVGSYYPVRTPKHHIDNLKKQKDAILNDLKREIENSSFLAQKYKTLETEQDRLQNNLETHLKTHRVGETRLGDSYHARPTRQPKQSTDVQNYINNGNEEENAYLREENKRLKGQLKKAKSFIDLLQKQIRQLSSHADMEGSNTYRNHGTIDSLNSQIEFLTLRLKENQGKGDSNDVNNQVDQLRTALIHSKKENDNLRKNMTKLINDYFSNTPQEDSSHLCSYEDGKALKKESYYVHKLRDKKSDYYKDPKEVAKHKNSHSTGCNYRSSQQADETPSNTYSECEDPANKIKTEAMLFEMASLLEESSDNKDHQSILRREMKSCFPH